MAEKITNRGSKKRPINCVTGVHRNWSKEIVAHNKAVTGATKTDDISYGVVTPW
jgi:hypothetical protein